ncbi:hypothetical protein [Stigmatella erecta]|uniref:Uncharacterized protein n=1 Tax=Stigmatella erecta TaxID=83460 RepID=A0A1I0LAQ7_9BACT|nr:hypothetical protein [Stigmatella erecta]SEU37126.1 hypothetical protein SAMN05443639_12369 [Stigmatella erecta]
MTRPMLKAVWMMTFAVPGLALAQTAPHYTDPNTYQVEVMYPPAAYATGYVMNDSLPWESSYPFVVGGYYTSTDQAAIINEEVDATGGILSSEGGAPLININQGNIPEAVRPNVPPVVEHFPSPDSMQVQTPGYNKSYSRTQSFGNSMFGGGYAIDTAVTATDGTLAEAKTVEAFADGKVFGTAFNTQKELVRGRVDIKGQANGPNTSKAVLYAMGQQIWSSNLSARFEPTPVDWSRTFFSISKTFMVGPVPISVKASLAGGVKLKVLGEINPTLAKLTAEPGGFSNVTASASVNIIVASFGVEGGLTLINAKMPTLGQLDWPLCTVNWQLSSKLNLNTLSGTLSLFAKIKFLFFSKKWTVTIARWNGLTYDWTLLGVNGTKDLGICTSNDNAAPPLLTASAN